MKKKVTYLAQCIYPAFIGICTDEKAFAKEMKRLDIQGVNFVNPGKSATVHIYEIQTEIMFIICLSNPQDYSPAALAGLLSHEATHIIQYLWEFIGETEPGKEAEAYMIQYIVQSAMNIMMDTGMSRAISPKVN